MNGKANSGHTHDDRYYTESEINSKFTEVNVELNGKADKNGNSSNDFYVHDLTGNVLYANSAEMRGSTPYIDFHFNNNSGDYTSRIQEIAPGRLQIKGTLVNPEGYEYATNTHLSNLSNCKFRGGTVVRDVRTQLNGAYIGKNYLAVFSNSEIASILGISVNSVTGNTVATFFMNGDAYSFDSFFGMSQYYNSYWYLYSTESLPAGEVRINYLICYYG